MAKHSLEKEDLEELIEEEDDSDNEASEDEDEDEDDEEEDSSSEDEDDESEEQGEEEEEDDDDDDLPSSWQKFFDESAQCHYYYNKNTQEASWLRPEDAISVPIIASGGGSGVRDILATTRSAMTTVGTTSSLLGTLRPRVNPISTWGTVSTLKIEKIVSKANSIQERMHKKEEERRLRFICKYMKHRQKALKSNVVPPPDRGLLHDQPSNSAPSTLLTAPKFPKGVRNLPSPTALRQKDMQRRAEEAERLLTAHSVAEREYKHSQVLEDRDRALFETIAKRKTAESAFVDNAGAADVDKDSDITAGSVVDSEVWSSMKWPVVGGLRHPPVARTLQEFDEAGELALVLASQKMRPPKDDVYTRITNRFVDGVDTPRRFDGRVEPPILPPAHLQDFGEAMDHYALQMLYFWCGGQQWHHSSGWEDKLHGKHAPGHHATWYGVHTLSASSERVCGLVLPKNEVRGTLLPDVGWMDKLKTLCLPGNGLFGPLPEAWSSLTSLKTLDLSSNTITGALPAKFFTAAAPHNTRNGGRGDHSSGLRTLSLAHNQLTGNIPHTISFLVGLTTLDISDNNLSGPLPSGITYCRALRFLRLNNNMLSGPLPHEGFGNLTRLASLEIEGNKLTGAIPKDLPRSLRRLHLSNNRLERDVPRQLYQCSALADISLSSNYLSGPVSDDVINLKGLRVFHLDNNRHTEQDRAIIIESVAAFLPNLVAQKGFRI